MRIRWICLLLSLLFLSSTAVAEPFTQTNHLLWDIPFDITATQLSEHLDQLGLFDYSWLQAESGDGVRIVSDSGREFSYFDIPVVGVYFDFEKKSDVFTFAQATLLFDISFSDDIDQYADAFLLLTQKATEAIGEADIAHPLVVESVADTSTELTVQNELLLQSELDRETLINIIEQGYVNHCTMTIGNMSCWLEYSMDVGRLMLVIKSDTVEETSDEEFMVEDSPTEEIGMVRK